MIKASEARTNSNKELVAILARIESNIEYYTRFGAHSAKITLDGIQPSDSTISKITDYLTTLGYSVQVPAQSNLFSTVMFVSWDE